MADTIRMLCKTAVTFNDRATKRQFTVRPEDRLILRDAPAWITQDPMFAWLVKDGTIEVADVTATQKTLENDPVQGADVTGVKNTRKPRKKPASPEKPDAEDVPADNATDEQDDAPAAEDVPPPDEPKE